MFFRNARDEARASLRFECLENRLLLSATPLDSEVVDVDLPEDALSFQQVAVVEFASEVSLADADTSPLDLQTADVSETQNADAFELSDEQQAALVELLGSLGETALDLSQSSALNTELPLIGRTLNDMLKAPDGPDWGDFLSFQEVVSTAFDSAAAIGNAPTTTDVVNALTDQLGLLSMDAFLSTDDVGPIVVSGGFDADTQELRFDVGFKGFMNLGLPIDISTVNDELGIQIAANINTDPQTISGVDLAFSFGLSLADGNVGEAFMEFDRFVIDAVLTSEDFDSTFRVGLLAGSIKDGTLDLNARASIGLSDTVDPDGDGRVTFSDLARAGTDIFASPVTSGSLQAELPLAASVAGVDLADGRSPRVVVMDDDLFGGPAPEVTVEDLDSLLGFRDLTTGTLVGALSEFGEALDRYRDSSVFDIPIPFTGADIGDALDFATAFNESFATRLDELTTDFEVIDPDDDGIIPDGTTVSDDDAPFGSTIAAFAGALAESLGVPVDVVSPTYDPALGELTFHVQFEHEFASFEQAIVLDESFAPLADVKADGTLTVQPTATVEFDFGVDLSPDDPNTSLETFIRDAKIVGQLPIEVAPFAATMSIGAIDLAANTIQGDVTGQFSLEIKDVTGNTQFTLGEFFEAAMMSPADVADFNANVSANLSLGDIIVADGLVPVPEDAGIALQAQVTADRSGVTLPSIEDGTLVVDISGVPSVDSLKNLGVSDIIAGLNQVVEFLAGDPSDPNNNGISGFAFLNTELPLVNRSVVDLFGFADDLAMGVDDAVNNPSDSLQEVERQLELALGIDPSLFELSFDVDEQSGQITTVLVDFRSTAGFRDSLPLDLQLSQLAQLAGPEIGGLLGEVTDFVSLSGSGNIDADMDVTLDVNLGIDVTGDSSRAFLRDTTGVTLDARLAARNLNFDASVGPISLFVSGGSAVLDGDGNAATDDAVRMRFGLKPDSQTDPADANAGDGRYYFDDLTDARRSLTDFVSASVSSSLDPTAPAVARATLPLYFPTRTTPIGSLEVEIPDLEAFFLQLGSSNTNPATNAVDADVSLVEISTPDLSGLFDNVGLIELLANPGVLVDGLDSVLQLVQSQLDTVTGSEFPIIGTQLKQATQFVGDFREEVLAAVRPVATNDNPIDFVRGQLFDLFGPQRLNLLLQADNPGDVETGLNLATSIEDVGLRFISANGEELPDAIGAEAVQFDVRLGQNVVQEAIDLDFDLGLPGLGLELESEGDIKLDLGWDFLLSFGLSEKLGFYYDANDADELAVEALVTLPGFATTGSLQFLQAKATDDEDDPSRFEARFAVDIKDKSSDGLITGTELLRRGGAEVETQLTANGDLNFNLDLGINGEAVFPRLVSDFNVDWQFQPSDPDMSGGQPTVAFNNVAIDLGSFLSDFVNPALEQLRDFTKPIEPLLAALQTEIPVVSDLVGSKVTLASLPEDLINFVGSSSKSPIRGSVTGMTEFIESFPAIFIPRVASKVTKALDEIGSSPDGTLLIPLGSFQVGGDPRDERAVLTPNATAAQAGAMSVDEINSRSSTKLGSATLDLLKTFEKSSYQFPILTNPAEAFNLLLGDDANLFIFDSPRLAADIIVDLGFKIPPFDFPVEFKADLDGRFSAGAHVAAGFDTAGLRRFIKTNNPAHLLDSLFISDTANSDGTGPDVPEIFVDASLALKGSANLALIRGSASGNVAFDASVDLADPNNDGKLRVPEIIAIVKAGEGASGFLDLFDVDASFGASGTLKAEVFNPLSNWKHGFGWYPRGSWEEIFKLEISEPDIFRLQSTPPKDVSSLAVLDDDGTLTLSMGINSGGRTVGGGVINESFVVSQAGGTVTVTAFGASESHTGVKRVFADGGDGNDSLSLNGVTVSVEFDAGSGNDRVVADPGTTGAIAFDGGNGQDAAIGGSGNDSLAGGDGRDTLVGGVGNDQLDGGSGDDVFHFGVGFGNDIVTDDGTATSTLNLRGDAGSGTAAVTTPVLVDLAHHQLTAAGHGSIQFATEDVGQLLVSGQDNSVRGPDEAAVWTLTANNQLELQTDTVLELAGFSQVTGGALDDRLEMTDARYSLSGTFNGGGGRDTLDYGGWTESVTINLQDSSANNIGGFANVEVAIGGRESDVLVGTNSDNTWNVTGGNSGNLGADAVFAFRDIETLQGGTRADRFVFSNGASLDGVANGGAGADTVDASSVLGGLIWDITSTDIGNATTQAGFQFAGFEDVQNLIGNAEDDAFRFVNLAEISGTVDGLGGEDELDFRAYLAPVTIDLTQQQSTAIGRIQNIEHAAGGQAGDTLIGNSLPNVLVGGPGADVIEGRGGQDILWGGDELLPESAFKSLTTLADVDAAEQFAPTGYVMPSIVPVSAEGASQPGLGDGNDSINGGDGSDWIFGGGDEDALSGGQGDDYLDGGTGNDTVFGDEGDDVVRGGSQDDVLHGGIGIDQVLGDDGDDVLFGDAGNGNVQLGQRLFGGAGQDTLNAFAPGDFVTDDIIGVGGDQLFGDGGNDQLNGSVRNEWLVGGSGNDELRGDQLLAGYEVNLDAGTTGGADRLRGGSGEDRLSGGGGDDELLAGADTDVLDGQAGSDSLFGGSGIDVFLAPTSPELNTGVDVIDGHFGNEQEGDRVDDNATDILRIDGTLGDDLIVVSQTADGSRLHISHTNGDIEFQWLDEDGRPLLEQIQIDGLSGDDVLGLGTFSPLPGIEAFDLTGTGLNEVDLTAQGRDFVTVINGGPGDDLLAGTSGRDRLDGSSGSDTLFGLAGDDRLWGDVGDGSSSDADVLFAGQGNDDLIGGQGVNDLHAWSFDPTLGDDFGVFMDDTGLLFADSDDGARTAESTGLNRMVGGPGEDRLFAGTEVDFLGGDGNDQLFRADGSQFANLDQGEAGDEWKEFARESDDIWYVSATNAADEITVDFVTEPGVLSDHHLITRLTDNGGAVSFAAQLRLDFSARDANGQLIWDASDDWSRANSGSDGQDALTPMSTQLTGGLLPDEGSFEVILVDTWDGNDSVTVGPTVQTSVWVDGGAGDDVIEIRSGSAILVDLAESGTDKDGLRVRNDSADHAFLLDVDTDGTRFEGLTIDHPGDSDWFRVNPTDVPDGLINVTTVSDGDEVTVSVYGLDRLAAPTAAPLATSTGQQSATVSLSGIGDSDDMLIEVTTNQTPTIYELSFSSDSGTVGSVRDLGVRSDVVRRDVLVGGKGNDVLIGGAGEDFVFGRDGNDVLIGGQDRQASDLLFGGPGDDTFQLVPDELPALDSGDSTLSDEGSQTFIPTFSDQLVGGDLDEVRGDRVLFAGGDLDRRGLDVPDFATLRFNTVLGRYELASQVWDIGEQAFRTTTETTLDGNTLTLPQLEFAFYQARGIEHTEFDLGRGNDVLRADSGFQFLPVGASDVFDANAFSEWGIDVGDHEQGGTISSLLINGGAGDDLLFGGARPDTVLGGPGDDTIVGETGNDMLDGESGKDAIFGRTSDTQLFAPNPSLLGPQGPSEDVEFVAAAPTPSSFQSEGAVGIDLNVTDTDTSDLDDAFGFDGVNAEMSLSFPRRIGDFNGDGFDDFMALGDGVSYVFMGPVELNDFVPASEATSILIDFTAGRPAESFGDINGDGLADIPLISQDGSETVVRVVFGSAERDWPRNWDEDVVAGFGNEVQELRVNNVNLNPDDTTISVLDFGNDNFDDLLVASSSTDDTGTISRNQDAPSIHVDDTYDYGLQRERTFVEAANFDDDVFFVSTSKRPNSDELDGDLLVRFDGDQFRAVDLPLVTNLVTGLSIIDVNGEESVGDFTQAGGPLYFSQSYSPSSPITGSSQVLRLDNSNGSVEAVAPIRGTINELLATDDGLIYVAGGSGLLEVTSTGATTAIELPGLEPIVTIGGRVTSFVEDLTIVDNQLFFRNADTRNGTELWRLPIGQTTAELLDFSPGNDPRPDLRRLGVQVPLNSDVADLTPFDGKLYFTARTQEFGREILALDPQGNEPDTIDVLIGSASSQPHGLTVYGNSLYFAATGGPEGEELWRYRPGQAPELVADLNPNGGSNPTDLRVLNGQLYFSVTTSNVLSGSGQELWRTDGQSVSRVTTSAEIGRRGEWLRPMFALEDDVYFVSNNVDNPGESALFRFGGPRPFGYVFRGVRIAQNALPTISEPDGSVDVRDAFARLLTSEMFALGEVRTSVISDVDTDGRRDLVVLANGKDARILTADDARDISVSRPLPFSSGDDGITAVLPLGDLNGDGRTNLATVLDDGLQLHAGSNLEDAFAFVADAIDATAADLDGDDRIDLVVITNPANSLDGAELQVFRNFPQVIADAAADGGLLLNSPPSNTAGYVGIPDAVLADRDVWTFEVTLSTDTTRDYQSILNAYGNNDDQIGFALLDDDTIQLEIDDQRNDDIHRWQSPTRLTDGATHHLALVSHGDDVWSVHVDGMSLGERTIDLPDGKSQQVTLDEGGLIVGHEQDRPRGSFGSNEAFVGRLNEVRFWNTARTPDQISENQTAELLGTEDGLVALYQFGVIEQGDNNSRFVLNRAGNQDAEVIGNAGSDASFRLDAGDADVRIPLSGVGGLDALPADSLDLNADGLSDLLVGLRFANSPSGEESAGRISAIYGSRPIIKLPSEFDEFSNATIPGLGSILIAADDDQPQQFPSAESYSVNANQRRWFRFTTAGLGTAGDFIEIQSATDGATPFAILATESGRLLTPNSTTRIDLNGRPAGTYFLAVDTPMDAEISFNVHAPERGAAVESDRDRLTGGDGDDRLFGNDALDQLLGGSGADSFVAEPIEVRDPDVSDLPAVLPPDAERVAAMDQAVLALG